MAYEHGVSHSVQYSNDWLNFLDTGAIARRPQSVRQGSTSARKDPTVIAMAKRYKFDPAVALNRDFKLLPVFNFQHKHIATHTTALIYVLVVPWYTCPPLTPRHSAAQLEFARDHVIGNLGTFAMCYSLTSANFVCTFGVWRQQNERYRKCCISEHDMSGSGFVIVWACTSRFC